MGKLASCGFLGHKKGLPVVDAPSLLQVQPRGGLKAWRLEMGKGSKCPFWPLDM